MGFSCLNWHPMCHYKVFFYFLKLINLGLIYEKNIYFYFLFICIWCQCSGKENNFDKELFNKAQSEGKIVVVSSWIKYCSSCANQMKILKKAKKEGKLSDIKFENIEYFSFDVTNNEIANLFGVQYQTTLLIFKGDQEVYRSIGETTEELIYEALKTSI